MATLLGTQQEHASWRDYLELTKPRVVVLMLITSLVGMFLATRAGVAWPVLVFGNLGIGLCAGGAAAVNHVVDRRIDALMARTQQRPLAQGRVSAASALAFALLLAVCGLALLLVFTNALAAWLTLVRQSWRFLACVCLLQGAHAAYYGFSAIYWQQAGYSASAVGYLWSLGVVAEVVIFALSKKVFRRFSARDLLLLSAACGLIRWGLMGWTTALPGLILAQILHCGTFTVCHLAAMRYIAARQGSEVIRLQAVYSAVAMGGSIAIMTVFAGFLYQNLHQGVFWVMALLTLPAMAIRPKAVAA